MKKRKLGRKLLSFLLTLAMVVGLVPGMGLTAYAEGEATPTAAEVLKPTVKDDKVTDAKVLEYAGKKWYVIASGTTGVQIANGAVTSQTGETTLVLLAKENWGSDVKFYGSPASSAYGSSNLKTTIDSLVTSEGIGNYYTSEDEKWKNGLIATRTLAGGASPSDNYASVDNIYGSQLTGATLWPLSAKEVSQINNPTILKGSWWLRSPGKNDGNAAVVDSGSLNQVYAPNYYGVRPALCLNLTSDIFASKKSDGVYELTNEAPHNHNFTYLSDDATITATCTATGCTNPAVSATLTINAPTLSTYGGAESEMATLTGLDAFKSATGKTIATTDIKYIGRDGTTYEESTTAPTDAGKYTASITVEEKTASVNYEIAKANPTAPTSLTATYGQTLANVTLPDGWTWADSTQNVGSVGSNTFKANFAGDSNYNAASDVDVTVTVGKGDYTADEISEMKPTAKTVTYNGEAQTIIEIPDNLPEGAEIKLKESDEKLSASQLWGSIYGDGGWIATPEKTDVGTYYYYWKITPDSNHNPYPYTNEFTNDDADNLCLVATINKANAVAATVTANNRTYDGTEKPLVTVTGETTGGTLKFAVTTEDQEPAADAYNLDTTSIPTATNVGTYYVWYKVVGDENHVDTEPEVLKVTIDVAKGETKIETEVQTDDKSPKLEASNLTKDVAESTLTDKEKEIIDEAVNSGKDVDVDVYLAIRDIADEITAEDKAKLEAKASDAGQLAYFDISLFKEIIVDGYSQGATSIHELATPLKLTIGVPKSFPAVADGYTRTYVVLRLHDGVVTVLPASVNADGTISFETDRLSTYAVAYTDSAIEEEVETVDMYRLYNPNSGEHFYTANIAEKDKLVKLGWRYEGIGWKAPVKSNTPVYRLYNPNAGDHHYTRSIDERDYLVSLGWKYEGIGWYSDDAESVPLYRQYNPNAKAGNHNYTASKSENDWLVGLGWRYEGVGWYGVK